MLPEPRGQTNRVLTSVSRLHPDMGRTEQTAFALVTETRLRAQARASMSALLFKDSVATMPLIFVLSAGADPTECAFMRFGALLLWLLGIYAKCRYLLTLAAEKGYTEKLHFISLGQGQARPFSPRHFCN